MTAVILMILYHPSIIEYVACYDWCVEAVDPKSLPDDLLLNCFARISRLYYPTLPDLSLFHGSFTWPDHNARWYTLCRKPNQTKKSSGYVLALLAIPHTPQARPSGLVAVGSNIYNIERSSWVSVLDCWSHTCLLLQELFEVFDTKIQIWDPEPIPCDYSFVYPRSACIDGKFYTNAGTEVVAYDSKEGRPGGLYQRKIWCAQVKLIKILSRVIVGIVKWCDHVLTVPKSYGLVKVLAVTV
ncbi:hypothetical protein EUTSA_v10026777mg [Eutrema salsugineum]|uniref:F-box associated domain-containing protein n=1 Tax=Eutrema salsugineum TaxID=72664 RepID=V4LZN6_EUTSA|nr:hypothetical protein EUTSA_v10026777mg [Eutrema salsugineum]